MKRNNKKGFTIVELVIVIAVIAILSAVLIPTFGGITTEAKDTARDLDAKNLYTEYLAASKGEAAATGNIKVGEYYYTIANGQLNLEETKIPANANLEYVWCDNHADPAGDSHNQECDNCGATIVCTTENCTH